jgi:hypothetical protein
MSKNRRSSRASRQPARKNNTTWIIGIVGGAVLLVLALVVVNLSQPRGVPVAPSAVAEGRTLGPADAPVTVEVYSDFQ